MATVNGSDPASLPHPNPTSSFWHSEPSALLKGYRTSRNVPEKADIVVIGSGMAGTSVVWHLLEPYRKAGNQHGAPIVCLLEAREICWGATGRNGGHCQPLLYSHPDDPEIGHFELLNHATVATLAGAKVPSPSHSPAYPSVPPVTKTFPCEFVVQPSARAYYSPEEKRAVKEDLAALTKTDPTLAAHCTVIEDEAGLRDLRLPGANIAVVTDTAGRMWPYKFVAGVMEDLLLDPALEGKVNVQTWTPVVGLEKDGKEGGWDVKTDRGTVKAGQVVLATNAYTSHLLPEFADLIVPCKGQMSALKPSEELKDGKRLKDSYGFQGPAMDDYLVQRDSDKGGHLMFGGGSQYGSRIGATDDSTVDEQATKYLQASLPAVFDLKDRTPLELEQTWTGIMGFSRDEHVFVGPVPRHDGIFMTAGFTGHGMPNTWLCGKAVATMVSKIRDGEKPDAAVDAGRSAVKLPRSYLLSEKRMEEARRHPTVLEQDRAFFYQNGKKRERVIGLSGSVKH